MAYQANGVHFDGANDYLTRGADLTGNTDSKLFSGALWFKRATTGFEILAQSSISSWRVRLSVNGSTEVDRFAVLGEDTSNAVILEVVSSITITDTAWHHAIWSFDMANTGKRHLYIDDVDRLSVNTYSDVEIDFTASNHAICANTVGGNLFEGDLADVWIAPGQYIDLSLEANRRKFMGPNGGAVDLGVDGSTPTGVAPLMFFSGDTSTWHTNDGTGSGFTENGALTDAATDPPSEPDTSSLVLERGLGRGIQRGIMRGV